LRIFPHARYYECKESSVKRVRVLVHQPGRRTGHLIEGECIGEELMDQCAQLLISRLIYRLRMKRRHGKSVGKG